MRLHESTWKLTGTKATGISRELCAEFKAGIPGNFFRFRRELRGIHIFVAQHNIFSVLTHSTTQAYRRFLSKTFSDVLGRTLFSLSRFDDLPNIDIETSLNRIPIADRSGQLTTCKATFRDFARTDRYGSITVELFGSIHSQLARF